MGSGGEAVCKISSFLAAVLNRRTRVFVFYLMKTQTKKIIIITNNNETLHLSAGKKAAFVCCIGSLEKNNISDQFFQKNTIKQKVTG